MSSRLVAALLLAPILLLGACGRNAGPGAAGRKGLGPSVSLNAAGEPGWSAQLRAGKLRFTTAEAPAVVVQAKRTDTGPDSVVWSGPLPGPNGRPAGLLRLSVARKACQDASTGLAYPLTAVVDFGAARFAGCAAPAGQGLGPRS